MPHLTLDQALVDGARAFALHIVAPVIDYISAHTTGAIERATLRLLGVDGVDEGGAPLPNSVVDSARSLLSGGILRPFVAAMLEYDGGVQATARAIGRGECSLQAVDDARIEKIDAGRDVLQPVLRGIAIVKQDGMSLRPQCFHLLRSGEIGLAWRMLAPSRYRLCYLCKQASSCVVEGLAKKYVDRSLST